MLIKKQLFKLLNKEVNYLKIKKIIYSRILISKKFFMFIYLRIPSFILQPLLYICGYISQNLLFNNYLIGF